MSEKKFVIIAAAGFGTRMNSPVPKQFLLLKGTPVIVHTIHSFLKIWKDAEFIVVLPEEEFPRWEKIRRKFLKKIPIRVTKGGATRFHSVKNGLKLVKEEGIVAIQDACRPFVSPELLWNCLESVQEKGNGVPAVDLKDSIREIVKDGTRHRNREKYKVIQTPQCFHVSDLKKAYQQTFQEEFTDDASVAEAAGQKIYLVDGDPFNFKITTKSDLEFGRADFSCHPLTDINSYLFMKISGFTFVRNGIQLRYPFTESIRSILPICEEMIVVVGNNDDGTREAIEKLHSEKIRIIDTTWNDSLREGGKILAQQTNIAFDAISGDWGFYLQGDEVIHENDLEKISGAAKKYLNDHAVDGLLFKWLHFFGSYDYVAKPMSRGAYPFEVRLIRNTKEIRSYRDAQGFRRFPDNNPEDAQRLRVKKIDAAVYHYGKVRGPIDEFERAKSFNRLWHDDEWMKNFSEGKSEFNYVCKFPLVKFTGTHPAVMKDRIAETNWNFIPNKKNIQVPFKYKLLNALQSVTGRRPFEFRNYFVV